MSKATNISSTAQNARESLKKQTRRRRKTLNPETVYKHHLMPAVHTAVDNECAEGGLSHYEPDTE